MDLPIKSEDDGVWVVISRLYNTVIPRLYNTIIPRLYNTVIPRLDRGIHLLNLHINLSSLDSYFQ